jgi:farnesyl diphosphate synthase
MSEKLLLRALEVSSRMIDQKFGELLPESDSKLHQAMRYAIFSPGKKLRPFLVAESAAVVGLSAGDALRVGAAIECIHCYSLVHDDLPALDNDDLRRGLPTTHRKYDEATAILVGDALQTLAFEILAHKHTHPDATIRTTLILNLAKAAGATGMVEGQMLDIAAETKSFGSLAEISAMQSKKTGALFGFSCESGPVMAQEDPAPLRQYADHLGLAFQIADDILDVESTPETLGKATQKDRQKGKATFVDFLGIDAAKKEALRLCDAAISALDQYDEKADLLRATARFVITRQK